MYLTSVFIFWLSDVGFQIGFGHFKTPIISYFCFKVSTCPSVTMLVDYVSSQLGIETCLYFRGLVLQMAGDILLV